MVGRSWTGRDLPSTEDRCYPLSPPFETKVKMLEKGRCYARGHGFECHRLPGHTGRHAAYGTERVWAVWE